MWIPESAESLEKLVEMGSPDETRRLEFKRQLPASSRKGNWKIAREVAGLTVSGGTIIYGVAEDEETGQPAELHPFDLANQRERVEGIVLSAIEEPPEVQVIPLRKEDGTGYLAVIVPASDRAPHQVTSRDDNRYYGRSGTLTVPLSEDEVARLYRQRSEWLQEREEFLERVITEANEEWDPKGRPMFYVGVRPLRPVSITDDQFGKPLQLLVDAVREETGEPGSPGFLVTGNEDRLNGTRALMSTSDDRQYLDVRYNGELRFVSSRPGDNIGGGDYHIFATVIGVRLHQVLALAGRLIDEAGYLGSVAVGFALVGAKGTPRYQRMATTGLPLVRLHSDDVRETGQVLSSRLREAPQDVARELTRNLYRVLNVPASGDPFRESG